MVAHFPPNPEMILDSFVSLCLLMAVVRKFPFSSPTPGRSSRPALHCGLIHYVKHIIQDGWAEVEFK